MPDVQRSGGDRLAASGGAGPRGERPLLEPPVHRSERPLLAVTPTCHWIEYLDVAAPVLAEPLRPVDGALVAPSRPSLGLAWDEAAVRHYAID
jgi:mandelate racemase